jgi:hypothetical protein
MDRPVDENTAHAKITLRDAWRTTASRIRRGLLMLLLPSLTARSHAVLVVVVIVTFYQHGRFRLGR